MIMMLKKYQSTYLIELTIDNKIKKQYRFLSFSKACLFFYKDIKPIVFDHATSSSAYYNSCLFLLKNNSKKLLIRKNLSKVYFDNK